VDEPKEEGLFPNIGVDPLPIGIEPIDGLLNDGLPIDGLFVPKDTGKLPAFGLLKNPELTFPTPAEGNDPNPVGWKLPEGIPLDGKEGNDWLLGDLDITMANIELIRKKLFIFYI
jgi:hypothetical protein